MLLLGVLVGCEDSTQPASDGAAVEESVEESFESYSRKLFAELNAEPLDTTLQTEIGLFGDMSVGGGDRVVMRQYRYRIDSTEFGPLGYMAFQVRSTEDESEPVPVVLTFVERNGAWRLDQAVFGRRAYNALPDDDLQEGPEQPRSEEAPTPVHASLRARLDTWLGAAVSRTASRD